MARGRYRKTRKWQQHDSVWQATRRNNLAVFHEIRRLRKKSKPLSVMRIIDMLSRNENWAWRMRGKSRQSWEVSYSLWLRQLAKATNTRKSS